MAFEIVILKVYGVRQYENWIFNMISQQLYSLPLLFCQEVQFKSSTECSVNFVFKSIPYIPCFRIFCAK